MSESNPLRPGQKFGNGRFVLVRFLGRGGMGEVWLAQDERLHEHVALKFLPSEICGDPVALDDLRRETARSHRLTHPNIVRIHDLHEDPDGTAFIVMEYIDGPTLASLRLEQPIRVFAWTSLRPLLEQLCAALDYAHGEKVIHRDLKPPNLMVDGRGRLKLADFGIAAVASDSMSRVSAQHSTSGTLPYMSPQQLVGKRPQVTDDIYALGATLYELLASQPPFHSGDITHQVLHEVPEPMEERLAALEIANEIPADAGALIMACLAKEPGQRPQSAMAVAEWTGLGLLRKPSTESLAAALFPEAPSSPEAAIEGEHEEKEASTPKGNGRKFALTAIVILIVIAGIYWLEKGSQRNGSPNPPVASTVPVQTTVSPPVPSASPQGQMISAAIPVKSSDLPREVRQSLILYYDFDSPPLSGKIADKSGHGNNGKLVNVRWVKDGHRGGAAGFGLNSSYITVPNRDEINPSQLTLAAWIKTSQQDAVWRRIFDKGYGEGWDMTMGGDYKGKSFRGQVGFEPGKTMTLSGIKVSDGRWHHVVGTFDDQFANLYVDGQRVGKPGLWTGVLFYTTYDLTIGANAANPGVGEGGPSFDGLMDDVMVFNRALTAQEVSQLYEWTGGTAAPGVVSTQDSATASGLTTGDWIVLFDGHSADAWTESDSSMIPSQSWKIENDVLKNIPDGPKTPLFTREKFRDFELEFEWKIGYGGNSGIFYSAEDAGINREFQLIDNERAHFPNGGRASFPEDDTGALWAVIAPSGDNLVLPAGEWNQGRLLVRGRHVEHWINGRKVVEYELGSASLDQKIAQSPSDYFRNHVKP
jgi:serine/threonine protein kinase